MGEVQELLKMSLESLASLTKEKQSQLVRTLRTHFPQLSEEVIQCFREEEVFLQVKRMVEMYSEVSKWKEHRKERKVTRALAARRLERTQEEIRKDQILVRLTPKSQASIAFMLARRNFPRMECKLSCNQHLEYLMAFLTNKWVRGQPGVRLVLYADPASYLRGLQEREKALREPLNLYYMFTDVMAACGVPQNGVLCLTYDILHNAPPLTLPLPLPPPDLPEKNFSLQFQPSHHKQSNYFANNDDSLFDNFAKDYPHSINVSNRYFNTNSIHSNPQDFFQISKPRIDPINELNSIQSSVKSPNLMQNLATPSKIPLQHSQSKYFQQPFLKTQQKAIHRQEQHSLYQNNLPKSQIKLQSNQQSYQNSFNFREGWEQSNRKEFNKYQKQKSFVKQQKIINNDQIMDKSLKSKIKEEKLNYQDSQYKSINNNEEHFNQGVKEQFSRSQHQNENKLGISKGIGDLLVAINAFDQQRNNRFGFDAQNCDNLTNAPIKIISVTKKKTFS